MRDSLQQEILPVMEEAAARPAQFRSTTAIVCALAAVRPGLEALDHRWIR